MENAWNRDARVRHVRGVIDRLCREGVVVAESDGGTHAILSVAVTADDGDAVRRWVMRKGAAHTIALGYGMSALSPRCHRPSA
jgi:hypothetical protein